MSQSPTFLKQFFQLAIVNILSNLMVPLAGLIDVAFLGHLAEIRHLAGVALATVLFNYIYWLLNFLRMATTGTTAQAIGRNEPDTVLLIALRNGAIALGFGLLLLLFQVPIKTIGFLLLSATPEVKATGETFYDALIWGAPANLLGFVMVGWFLGRSQSRKVLLLSAVVSLANVLLDYLFIVRFGWGSVGAGAATAVSQYLMLAVGLLLILRELQWKQVKAVLPQFWDVPALQAAFILNGEIVVRTFALVTTFSLFTNLSSSISTIALAANTVLLQVVTFAAYFIDGLAFATESMAGMLQGQGRTDRLRQLIWMSGAASLVCGLLFAIAFITGSLSLFRLLTSHADVLNQIQQYVFWLFPVLGFGSIAYMLDGYFIGLTQGKVLRQSTVIAALGFLPIALFAWQLQNVHVLWVALSLFMFLRASTLGIAVYKMGTFFNEIF